MVKSLNENTKIKTQLVDAVMINDAAFFEAPIIFMEPVSASSLKAKSGPSSSLFQNPIWAIGRSRGTHEYTEQEVQRLREYVVNRGGFIYMPTHGNTEQAMQPALRVLRQILPEHQLAVVPNDHEIYNSYYKLNGPLRYPVRKIYNLVLHHGRYDKLKGIFIDGRLAVLVDTEAMMHVMDGAVQKPFYGHYADRNKIMVEFAPHAAKQLINLVVYATTHGGISDYSNYVPETALNTDKEAPKTAPKAIQKL